MDKVKDTIQRWKILSKIFFNEDKKVFIKKINGDIHFCKIILNKDDYLIIQNFGPKQRMGKEEEIYWAQILEFNKYKEVNKKMIEKFNETQGPYKHNVYFIECAKCWEKIIEKEIDLSHDIPLYIGGGDSNGRHYLCKDCHSTYERIILKRCFLKLFGEKVILTNPDKRSLIPYMNKLKNTNEINQKMCQKIAKEVKEEFFWREYKNKGGE